MSARLVPSDRAPGLHVAPGTEIPDDAEIAPHVTIYAGVEIGAEAVVGAASLVREDVPPRTVVAGSPARVLREVRDDELLENWREGRD